MQVIANIIGRTTLLTLQESALVLGIQSGGCRTIFFRISSKSYIRSRGGGSVGQFEHLAMSQRGDIAKFPISMR